MTFDLDSAMQSNMQQVLHVPSLKIIPPCTEQVSKHKKHSLSDYAEYFSLITPEYLARGSMMYEEVIYGYLLQLSDFKNNYDEHRFVIGNDGDGEQKFTLFYDSSIQKFPVAMENFMNAVKGNSNKDIINTEKDLRDVVKNYTGSTVGLLCREKRLSCILHKLARMYIAGEAPVLKDLYASRIISPDSIHADQTANSVHFELNRLYEFKVHGPVKRKNLPGHSSRGIPSDYGGYTFCTQITDLDEHIHDQKDRKRFVDSRNEIVEKAISKGHSVTKLYELCAPIHEEYKFRYS